MTTNNHSTDEAKAPLGAPWYRVSKWGDRIDTVIVTRSTSKQIWYIDKAWRNVECKAHKSSAYHDYFPTEAEAVEFLRKRYEREIEAYSRKADDARGLLDVLNKKYPA